MAITKRDRTTAVVLSLDAYQALIGAQAQPLASLSYEFDLLLQQMQGTDARDALMDAFDASPEDLGAAAVNTECVYRFWAAPTRPVIRSNPVLVRALDLEIC